jgi:outer membrane protein assembly factor BamD
MILFIQRSNPILIAQRWSRAGLMLLVSLFGVLALTGCSGNALSKDPTQNWSADRLYSEAKEEMDSGNWSAAVTMLEKLESRYPFGRYAQQAQIDTAFARWKEGENGLALAAIDRFLKLYPNHDNVDYVIYLRGLINFNDRTSLFTSITGEDLAERDPKAAREAFDSFKELLSRFPNSKYASDASARMNFLINTLASNDVHVARYYMRRGATLAAVNRAQAVVKQYQEAPAIEEALAIMVTGYQKLGLEDLSSDARRVLAANFPNSPYLTKAYDPTKRGGGSTSKSSVWSKIKIW